MVSAVMDVYSFSLQRERGEGKGKDGEGKGGGERRGGKDGERYRHAVVRLQAY